MHSTVAFFLLSTVVLLCYAETPFLAPEISPLNEFEPESPPLNMGLFIRTRRAEAFQQYQQYKKSFVRPCVFGVANCLTSTQQQRLLHHMRNLVAIGPINNRLL